MVSQSLYLLKAMRPHQWTKNLLLFAGVLFSKNLFEFEKLFVASGAFVVFCLVAGGIYIFNDLVDLEQDRRHPLKRGRPLASGTLKPSIAIVGSGLALAIGLLGAFRLSFSFGGLVGIYLVQNLLYTKFLKNIVIIDVMMIGFGFVLRAVSGAVVVDVEVSSWLILCTFLLSLFLGFSKRRQELVKFGEEGEEHRPILAEYSPHFLDVMISIVTGATIMSYALYTMSEQTIQKFQTSRLILTIPFIIYGIFRYLYLMYKQEKGENPTKILLTDLTIQLDIFLWIVAVVGIIYLGI